LSRAPRGSGASRDPLLLPLQCRALPPSPDAPRSPRVARVSLFAGREALRSPLVPDPTEATMQRPWVWSLSVGRPSAVFGDHSPDAPSAGCGGVAAAASVSCVCQVTAAGIDDCQCTFERQGKNLIAHQEGPEHLAIPYYCPFSAEHWPQAPCPRSQGGPGGLFSRYGELYRTQLAEEPRRPCRSGLGSGPCRGAASCGFAIGLRMRQARVASAAAAAASVPVFVGRCGINGCQCTFERQKEPVAAARRGRCICAIPD